MVVHHLPLPVCLWCWRFLSLLCWAVQRTLGRGHSDTRTGAKNTAVCIAIHDTQTQSCQNIAVIITDIIYHEQVSHKVIWTLWFRNFSFNTKFIVNSFVLMKYHEIMFSKTNQKFFYFFLMMEEQWKAFHKIMFQQNYIFAHIYRIWFLWQLRNQQ